MLFQVVCSFKLPVNYLVILPSLSVRVDQSSAVFRTVNTIRGALSLGGRQYVLWLITVQRSQISFSRWLMAFDSVRRYSPEVLPGMFKWSIQVKYSDEAFSWSCCPLSEHHELDGFCDETRLGQICNADHSIYFAVKFTV